MIVVQNMTNIVDKQRKQKQNTLDDAKNAFHLKLTCD